MIESDIEILNELIASRKLIKSSRGPFWFVLPTIKDKLFAKYIYDKTLQDCTEREILTVEQSLAEFKSQGLWDDLKEKNLERLPKFIEDTSQRIVAENNRVRRKKYEVWLRKLQRDFFELIQTRNTILSNSAEFISNNAASLYMAWSCLRDNADDNRLWPTFEQLEESSDINFVNELIDIFVEVSKDKDVSVIRRIARLPVWRVRWSACKGDIFALFGRSAQDMSNDQFMLIYWSQIYDSVYEAFERPPDSVVNDDEQLDEWLRSESEERERTVSQKFHGKSLNKHTSSKIDSANEIYKVVEGQYDKNGQFVKYSPQERWQQIEQIRKLNSPTARSIKQREEQKLATKPGVFVQEHELRKRREEREAMGGIVQRKVVK